MVDVIATYLTQLLKRPAILICENCMEPFELHELRNLYQLSPNNYWLCSDECRRLRINGLNRKYYQNDPEKQRLRARLKNGRRQELYKEKRISLLKLLSGGNMCCAECGRNDDLQFHHKRASDSVTDRLRFNGGGRIQSYYLKHQSEAKEKLQVLCGTCNVGKNKKYQ